MISVRPKGAHPHIGQSCPATQYIRAVGNPKFGVRRLISAFAAQGRSSPQNRRDRPLASALD